MKRIIVPLLILSSLASLSVSDASCNPGSATFRLDSLESLEMINAKGELTSFHYARTLLK